MSVPVIEKVSNEGAEIYCEHRGNNGSSLLLIHGAIEDAGDRRGDSSRREADIDQWRWRRHVRRGF